MKTQSPFALPSELAPDLARILAYWRGLLRGNADMPFADDLNLTDLPDLSERLLLIGASGPPERFRVDWVGEGLECDSVAGLFLDELAPCAPFEFLGAQCAATREGAAPTYYRRTAPKPYARLLVPFWGDGRIAMLLGAVDFG